jgi:hypothetical protein
VAERSEVGGGLRRSPGPERTSLKSEEPFSWVRHASLDALESHEEAVEKIAGTRRHLIGHFVVHEEVR